MAHIQYKDTQINFEMNGEGTPIVLLHGFLESLNVWGDFAHSLSRQFKTISIDLPGHGDSGIPQGDLTVEEMASAVMEVLKRTNTDRCIMVGHSMGGYVTLAFADLFPEKLYGFSLFHSVATPDTDEKREARGQAIKKVEKGQAKEIIQSHVPSTFAEKNRPSLSPVIQALTEDSLRTSPEGIIAALKAMQKRPDRQHLLKEPHSPVLYYLGHLDPFIPLEVSKEQANLSPAIHKVDLKNAGHMGHIEEKDKALNGLIDFVTQIK